MRKCRNCKTSYDNDNVTICLNCGWATNNVVKEKKKKNPEIED
jgi:rRNA maturation endonuclease Nob1